VMWKYPLVAYHYGRILQGMNKRSEAIRFIENALSNAKGNEYWLPEANQTLESLRRGIFR